MKKSLLLPLLFCFLQPGFGQQIWNKPLVTGTTAVTFAELRSEGSALWVSGDRSLLQVSTAGLATGEINYAAATFPQFWIWSIKANNATQPYFLLTRLQTTTGGNYTMASYNPHDGTLEQTVFSDSLSGSLGSKGHVFVRSSDSTVLVYGYKMLRSIRHRVNEAPAEQWSKALPFRTIDGFWRDNSAVFCDAFGKFRAFDASGNLLWEKTHAFTTRAMKPVADGIIGCGNDAGGEGLVFKLDLSGNLLWSKILPEKKLNDLTLAANGGILLTGETDTPNWLLMKTDDSGNLLWNHTFETGKGWEIEPDADGGAFVLWTRTGSAYRLNLARLDAAGNTVPLESDLIQSGVRTLRNSGVKTLQTPTETLFFDGSNTGLRIPADSATSTIFAHSPWIGAQDGGGNLRLAATTYGNAKRDYRAGIASSPAADFNRVWAVSREEIAKLRRDFGEDGVLDAAPPYDLLSWPAKGNPHFKQNTNFTTVTTNPDSLPAPFVDHNGDGKYNVFDGDYPRLLGDRMLWWARTDATIHEQSFGQPLGVDLLFSLYTYDCPENDGVSYTLFADYQVINRSGENFSNAYMGFFTDFDLGCFQDDYIGTLPSANSYYVYNQDATDGQPGINCDQGIATFGEKTPVQAVTFLNKSMDKGVYLGSFTGPNFPSVATEYYAHLQGLGCGGAPMTVGGTGCNPNGSVITDYCFFNNPADPQGWTMCTENLASDDRRSLSSHGPFNFAAGDTFSLRLAFTFHPEIPHPCPDVESFVKPRILQIQQWHDNGALDASLDLDPVQILQPGQSITLNATLPNALAYVWSNGATAASISVNQPGEYTVSVTRASGCVASQTVLVKSASGTFAPALPAWKIQPNPASEWLNILLDNPSPSPVTALLRNAQGQSIVRKTVPGGNIEIPVSHLPAGFYWVELWQDGKFLGGKKVMVD